MNLIRRFPLYKFSLVKPTTFEDDFQLIQCLGQGSTSRVYRSIDIRTNTPVTIKLFKKVLPQKILRQSRMLSLVRSCPHVQQLLEIVQNVGFQNYGFVFEYYPGETLNKLIKSVELGDIKLWVKQLMMALKCVHGKGIMHRDIKASNILISRDERLKKGKVVLLDFGLAEVINPDISLKFRVGTNCYKPPQILLKRTVYNQKIDIWGAGLILAQMLLKIKPLFKYQQDDKDIIRKVMRICKHSEQYMTGEEIKQVGQVRWEGIQEKSLSEEGLELAMKMMDFNPKRRPSAQEVLKSGFFKGVE